MLICKIIKISTEVDWRPTLPFKNKAVMMVEQIDDWKYVPLWEADSIVEATQACFKYMGSDAVYNDL